jgi:hypothetical protein
MPRAAPSRVIAVVATVAVLVASCGSFKGTDVSTSTDGGAAGAGDAGSAHDGSSGADGAVGNGTPDGGDASSGPALGYKRVFVTKTLYHVSSDPTDVQGFDTITDPVTGAILACNADAYLGLKSKGGMYLPWLSSGAENWSPSTKFTQSTVPYKLVDGTTIIAHDFTELTSQVLNQINVDEDGNTVNTGFAWTGTTSSGILSSSSCADWTSNSGSSFGSVGSLTDYKQWTQSSSPAMACNTSQHIYCFEQ